MRNPPDPLAPTRADLNDVDGDQGEGCAHEEHRRCATNLSRRQARSVIFHLLYVMETFEYDTELKDVVDNFNRGFDLDVPHDGYICQTTQAVVNARATLDEIIKPLLINWRFERIGLCTKLILRLAVWELMATQEARSIIINEAIELAKCFSETDAYRFINGILDEAAKIIRSSAEEAP